MAGKSDRAIHLFSPPEGPGVACHFPTPQPRIPFRSLNLDHLGLPNPALPIARAFYLGLAAYQAGQDVIAAVELAGYPTRVAVATFNKIMSNRRGAPSQVMPPAAAPVASSVKRYVKACMDRSVELRVYTLAPTGTLTPFSAAGTLIQTLVAGPIQGTAENSRTGDQIKVDRLTYRFNFYDQTYAASLVRVLMVKDLQPNGSIPVVTDILASASHLSFFNPDTVTSAGGSRFKILHDKTLQVNTIIAGSPVAVPYIIDVKGSFVVTFISNSGTSASVGTNNVWLLFIGNNATVTGNMAGQMYYRDL